LNASLNEFDVTQRCSDVDEWSEKSFRSRESVGDEVQASDQESDAENNEKRAEMFSHLGNQFQRACQGNSELKKELKVQQTVNARQ